MPSIDRNSISNVYYYPMTICDLCYRKKIGTFVVVVVIVVFFYLTTYTDRVIIMIFICMDRIFFLTACDSA